MTEEKIKFAIEIYKRDVWRHRECELCDERGSHVIYNPKTNGIEYPEN